MAKHRRMSERSRRTRTVIGGLAAGGALAAITPAGMAAAAAGPNEVAADTPGAAVGRPNLDNPAPGLRAAQQFGDSIFNQSSTVNKALDTSPVGQGYHQVFGQQGKLRYDIDDQQYYYDTTTGSNGSLKGVLNTTPGNIIGNVQPIRECNLESDPGSLAPKISIRAQCN
ncbi:hypothetical protein DVS77_28795 [Mycolicibacterium moriokaense]|nr:hypothetical protein DVS77_28795 [Mycolicibacterium moriokaense]